MEYRTFLQQSQGCPFCEGDYLDKNAIIITNHRAMVTVAKAPYVVDQLLVIPKRHVETISEMRVLESFDCLKLIRWAGRRLLQKGHAGYTLLLREGSGVGKSIPHVHIHLIPSESIDLKNSHLDRKVLSTREVKQVVKKFRV